MSGSSSTTRMCAVMGTEEVGVRPPPAPISPVKVREECTGPEWLGKAVPPAWRRVCLRPGCPPLYAGCVTIRSRHRREQATVARGSTSTPTTAQPSLGQRGDGGDGALDLALVVQQAGRQPRMR